MTSSISHVPTPKASRYLQQLCKHYGHKMPVEFDEHSGSITFPFGTCELAARDEVLTMTVSGGDTDKLEKVIGSHLERFAFKEPINVLWDKTVSS